MAISLVSSYTQNFDTLATSGTSNIFPAGWELSESGSNANSTYTAGTGSSNAGDAYSFGAAGSTERALGGLLSGSLTPTFGASFTNGTGGTITSLAVTYTGEQWRVGTLGRADRIDFQYSLNATSLTSGVWVDVNSLDFNAPTTTGTVGALNGNAAANRATISDTIAGLSVPAGSTFWIRWTDFNATGADDGLAIDDFSIAVADAPPPPPPPPPPLKPISQVQGSGAASPLAGQLVTVDAIVVGDFQGAAGLGGFFLQEEDADTDADPDTSEGLFVFQGADTTAVALGDRVRVSGVVTEFGAAGATLTELSGVTSVVVVSSGNPLPAAAVVTMPRTAAGELERFEGMRVTVPDRLTVTNHFGLQRFGEITLAADGPGNVPGTDARLDQYTQFNAPSVAGYSAWLQQQPLRTLVLDDGSDDQNPPTHLGRGGQPLSATNTLRGGDTVDGLTGVMDQRFGSFRVQPTAPVDFDAVNQRSAAPDVGGLLQVASFNLLNFFNGNGSGGGFPTSRGADSLAEFVRQRDKIVAAIVGTGAEVVGLLELENDGHGPASAIQDLVDALNAATAPGTWAFVDPGRSLGGDEIAVGLIYQPSAVLPRGAAAVLDSAVDPRFDSSAQRPSLAQTFEVVATGALFTPVVNHFKSKGTSAGGAGDADSGDGQGLSNGTRTRAAEALVDWLATDPTRQGDADFLILGDLNAYAQEDPLRAIRRGADDLAGTADDYASLLDAASYSFSFDGAWGALDHALASRGLRAQVTGAAEWPINADEPGALDYNVEFKTAGQQALYYAPDAFRSSDHDPLVIGLDPGITVSGTARGDLLMGTAGADRLIPGGGRDLVIGGAGADRFVFTSLLDLFDTIADFEPGLDRLDIAALMDSVGAGAADPLAEGYLVVFPMPRLTLPTGAALPAIATLLLFDPDGSAGAAAPRPLVQLIGVSALDPTLLLDSFGA